MPRIQHEIVELQLHPRARDLARHHIIDFANSLILLAKTLAFQREDDIVLANHIQEALDTLQSQQNRSWTKEILIVVGGTMFGAFLQGFVTEMSAGRVIPMAIYTAIGFLGMLIVFFALRRR